MGEANKPVSYDQTNAKSSTSCFFASRPIITAVVTAGDGVMPGER